MAIYTESKQAIGNEFTEGGVDATAWTRFEPLITPAQLKRRFLFGIPLVSMLANPVTGKREEMTDEDLKDSIVRAVGDMESEAGVYVLPVQKRKKLPFDRNEYMNLGYVQLPDRPVTSVDRFRITDASGISVYDIPPQWIDPGNFHRGQVNLIPLSAGFVAGGAVLPSQTAGGAFFLSILGQHGWIPSYWEITYTCGFSEGHLPIVVNELVGIYAAIIALDSIQATNSIAGFSVGLDAASQSVTTGGPQIYAERIKNLEAKKQVLLGKLKAKVGTKIFSSNV